MSKRPIRSVSRFGFPAPGFPAPTSVMPQGVEHPKGVEPPQGVEHHEIPARESRPEEIVQLVEKSLIEKVQMNLESGAQVATKLVLGPSQAGWNEPTPAPPLPGGNVPVLFGTPAVAAGGIVNFVIGIIDPTTTPVYPLLVHVVYIPSGSESDLVAGADPAAFLASANPQNVAPWPDTTVPLQVVVPGITPGLWFVQSVLEYPQQPAIITTSAVAVAPPATATV